MAKLDLESEKEKIGGLKPGKKSSDANESGKKGLGGGKSPRGAGKKVKKTKK